jgi:hypothetical protein
MWYVKQTIAIFIAEKDVISQKCCIIHDAVIRATYFYCSIAV